MKLAAALAALLLSSSAYAQTCATAIPDPVPSNAVRLSWTAPTQNTDGSAITKAITFTVYEGATAKCTTTATAGSLTGLSVGLHTWAVSAKTTDGESAKSMTASKTIPPSPPNPPTSLLVDPASLIAYTITMTPQTVATIAVGTVAPGTKCDPLQPVLDKFVLLVDPKTQVTYPPGSTVRPVLVVGQCG